MFQDTLSSSDLINTINGNLTVELRNAAPDRRPAATAPGAPAAA